jgi:hypothetical protein
MKVVSSMTLCLKGWGIIQIQQKPAKRNDRTAKGTLSFKRISI